MNIHVRITWCFAFLASLVLHSVDTSAQWYYPLGIGNRWEYWDAYPPPQMYAWTTRCIGDSVIPSAGIYRVLRSDRPSADQLERQVGTIVYQYVPYMGAEEVLYDFSKSVGDTVGIYSVSSDTVLTTVMFDFQAQVFGRSLRVKEFYERSIRGSMYVIRTVADSLGLLRMTYEPGEGGQAVGAIIDGIKYGTISDVGKPSRLAPPGFSLEQNYPNPFNPTTTISFSLSHSSWVTLTILNMLGQEMTTLVTRFLQAGTHSETWNAENCASGTYLCRLSADGQSTTTRMVLIK